MGNVLFLLVVATIIAAAVYRKRIVAFVKSKVKR